MPLSVAGRQPNALDMARDSTETTWVLRPRRGRGWRRLGARLRAPLSGRRILRSLLYACGLLAFWLFLAPATLGGRTGYVVVSGNSMEPTLNGGDFVLTRRVDGYSIGDVVAFRVPEGQPAAGQIVIHRIIDTRPSGFTTQGDNRDLPDLWTPAARDIVGREWIRVPGAGQAIYVLRSPLVLATIAGSIAFLLMLTSSTRRRDAT